ncbi:MAG: hypothetical protein HBSAPP02_28730 [Phycisphaerae bacterium]|nr:MAG: hypothetical protein HBSAPP02_28730 [Phycisphaerae bacterium]
MIKVTVIPRKENNLYGGLVKKELELRRRNQGTLHRALGKKAGEERWRHERYKGWINLQKCLGGVVVAVVRSKAADQEWQLLSSFVGFLDRHFRDHISSINLTYGED